MFPALAKKYFIDTDSADYKLSIKNQENQTIFQTDEILFHRI